MRRRLAARLLQSLIVVVLVTTISFFVIRAAPGDPFSYESTTITPELRQHWREQFGYNRPLLEQYVRYVASVLHGQLGYSFSARESVAEALATAIPRTLLLTGLSLGLSFLIGMIVGAVQAARRGSWFDRITTGVLVVFYSLPDFWGALMALLIFTYWWPILPGGGMIDAAMHDFMSPGQAALDRIRHLILPVGSLTLLTVAAIARYQRASLLEILPSDYIRTARAKGVSERGILLHHALRTALTPMITLAGLFLPALLGGAVFIERVFNWPGMGLLATNAIAGRDYDLVTATVIVGSVMVVVGNLIADLLQMALDPRVRE
ncbi:MAG TPA: ABC transporter permease [Gemmatimonadaceae bacterium]|jgi:peptide/nickel transport system permease protein|nr:ABC transporter permease [Gemmatimonadaceae bacterium]